MRLFKWIFKIILSLVILLVVVVGGTVALLYKNATPPVVSDSGFSLNALVTEQMDNLVDSNNTNKEIALVLSEDVINFELKKILTEEFSDNLSNSDDYLAVIEDRLMIQGAWVNLKENQFDIIVGIHIDVNFMKFKTRLLLSMKVVESTPSKLVLKIDKIKIGNLPLQWALKLAPKLLGSAGDFDLDGMLNESLGGIGKYESAKQQLTVDIKSLVAGGDNQMLTSLLEVVEENELIEIGVKKDGAKVVLKAAIDLNDIETTKTALKLTTSERIKTEEDFNTFLRSKVVSGLISGKVSLDDKDFLKLMDYLLLNGETTEHLVNEDVFENYQFKVLVPYFELSNKAVLNVPIIFAKGNEEFKTNVEMEVQFSKKNNDLVLGLSNAKIGTLEVKDALLKDLLSGFSSDDFALDAMSFVITDFFANFSDQNIKVDSITVSSGKVNFNFEGINVNEMLNEIIDDFANNEIKAAAQAVLDKITNDANFDDELEDLIDEFNNLSEQEQEDLMDLISKYFDLEE